MPESQVASALSRKRGELAGEIIARDAALDQRRAELVHLDAATRLQKLPEVGWAHQPGDGSVAVTPGALGDLTVQGSWQSMQTGRLGHPCDCRPECSRSVRYPSGTRLMAGSGQNGERVYRIAAD